MDAFWEGMGYWAAPCGPCRPRAGGAGRRLGHSAAPEPSPARVKVRSGLLQAPSSEERVKAGRRAGMGLWKGYHCRATAGLREVVQRKGRWREKEIRGSSWECLNFPPANREPGEQQGCHTEPLLPASGHSRSLEGAFAGKDRGWRLLGRQLGQGQAGRGGGAAATPSSPSRADGSRAHAPRCPSLPLRANHFRGTNTPFPSRRRHLQHLGRVVPLPVTRAIYTSKAQGEKSNTRHTVTESNKHRHRPGALPEPFCRAGSWASSQSPLP